MKELTGVRRGLRIVGIILLFLMFMVMLTSGYHAYMSHKDEKRYPPPGDLWDVNGHMMHIDCRGEGVPVMLLEAGLTSGSTSWYKVHEPLSRVTRVCTYDRPGLDWSDPRDDDFDARAVAQNLALLLDKAGISEPIIIVGMSAGGVYVREFHRQYPDRIAGMALIDSSHEQQGDRLPKFTGDNPVPTLLRMCSHIAPLGLIRVTGAMEAVMNVLGVEEGFRERTLAMMLRNHACGTVLREMNAFERDIHQVDAPTPLGDLPLLVLSQGAEPDVARMPPGYTLEYLNALRVVWNELQLELTSLSSRGRRVVATESGHVIQFDQPRLVIDELTRLIRDVRSSGHDRAISSPEPGAF